MLKKKQWVLRSLGVLLFLGLITYAITAILAVSWRHVPVTAPTTHITTPLAADGLPDYLAALNTEAAKGVTNDNNAASEILTIFGPEKQPPAWWNKQMEHMPAKPHLTLFVTLHEWCTTHSTTQNTSDQPPEDETEDKALGTTLSHLWSRDQSPLVAGYLDANKSQIDAIVALTKRDHFVLPLITEDGLATTVSRSSLLNVHYPLGNFREAANAMIQRSLLRLHDGDTAGFREDILAAVRLSALMLKQHTVLDYLVAAGIHQSAMLAIQRASTSPLMTENLAKDIQVSLAASPEWPSAADVMDNAERYSMLDMLAAVVDAVNHRGTSASGLGSPPPGTNIPLLPIHFEDAFVQANILFDRYADALRKRTYTERQAGIEAVKRDVDGLYPGGIFWGLMHCDRVILRGLMIDEGSALNKMFTTVIAQQRLTQAALALHLLHTAQGKYPSSLDETGLPVQIRTDPFTDAPMIYRVGSNSYLLYSVGPDLKDDGGKEKQNATQKYGYDLVIKVPDDRLETRPK